MSKTMLQVDHVQAPTDNPNPLIPPPQNGHGHHHHQTTDGGSDSGGSKDHDLDHDTDSDGELSPGARGYRSLPYPLKKKDGKMHYECNICYKTFRHSGERPFKCNTLRTLHSRQKPYACDLCPAKFTQFVHLKLHKRLQMSAVCGHNTPKNTFLLVAVAVPPEDEFNLQQRTSPTHSSNGNGSPPTGHSSNSPSYKSHHSDDGSCSEMIDVESHEDSMTCSSPPPSMLLSPMKPGVQIDVDMGSLDRLQMPKPGEINMVP
ncbi:PR domain zinc finger protein 1 [Orchesella cincta]|uniref:PR domain zinc finger protein 1 n=1 Tax=Orchesella cincta TaxID=48709 RepID=A0A1D2NI51_ORCCI|nr:PR domain zinc finger protein 1 [Orchesella cincta]